MKKDDSKFYWHWQNLNDLKGTHRKQGHPFWKGRAWFHFGDKCIGFEWNFKSTSFGMSTAFEAWGDGDVSFHFAIPPCSFWLSFDNFLPKSLLEKVNEREIGFDVHHWTLWVSLWRHRWAWSSSDPKWWSFSINFDPREWLLGGTTVTREVLEERDVLIPMPEKSYSAKIKMEEVTWTYKRAPFISNHMIRGDCDLEKDPIPFPGKGTASHNCGDDALHGLSVQADNVEEVIGKVVTNVLDKRKRYPL